MSADLYARLAQQAKADAQPRRTPNNPWSTPLEPERRTYADPTADRAIGNVDRERQKSQRAHRRAD